MQRIPRALVALVLVVGCGHRSNGGKSPDSNLGGGGDGPGGGGDAGCGLTSCMAQNAHCGLIGDGCGGTINCDPPGGCPMGQTCGGGGTPFNCGSGAGSGMCMPQGCGSANCGQVGDGCGGLTASCGTCATPQTCGGGGVASQCGCANLCQNINACTGMPHTTIDGFISAPGHPAGSGWTNNPPMNNAWIPDPVYGALVYVANSPNGALDPLPDGVAGGNACPQCADLVSGSPLVVATTDATGYFKLDNVPCGVTVPVVFQLGKWRREIFLPNVACCANTRLTDDQRHLPRNHTEGNIPLTAISTGHVDDIECVLRKIGIDDGLQGANSIDEFTNPSGTGRVVFYQNNGGRIDANTPAASTLYTDANELAKHDVTIMSCEGGENQTEQADTASQQRFVDYSNAGGRVFATHFSYVWLTNNGMTTNACTRTSQCAAGFTCDTANNVCVNTGNTAPDPFDKTAAWQVNQNSNDSTFTAFVDQTLQGDQLTQTRRIAFASWLVNIGASLTNGRVPVNVVRQDFNSVNQRAQQWVFFDKTQDAANPWTAPLHYTFDMPVTFPPAAPPPKLCGRVLFSDFHVEDARISTTTNFPNGSGTNYCKKLALTPQEQTLEFMLFDLASCVGSPVNTCMAAMCQPGQCGDNGDGCGGVIHCGGCPMGQTCGGGGPGMCGNTTTCMPLGCGTATCGAVGDGCGNVIQCGTCTPPLSCGGGGVANQCGGVF
jgi:hypothetical protein